ncbi:protein-L-isoaspartate O-methyltransferase family protein [Devosia crocina]|nr:protein-L-isoaspartate O-methyltransferase [Devosia crocina]
MIDTQLRPAGVTTANVLRAITAVPRERFVLEGREPVSYVDDLQPLEGGRFILSPVHAARMIQLAEISSLDRVLDVGTASGYSSAVLSHMARHVVALEEDASLAATARQHVVELGLDNVEIRDGWLDAVKGESFNVILVQGALDCRPDELIALLEPNGRLVVPVLRSGVANVQVFRQDSGGVMFASEFDATMPRLRTSVPAQEFVF